MAFIIDYNEEEGRVDFVETINEIKSKYAGTSWIGTPIDGKCAHHIAVHWNNLSLGFSHPDFKEEEAIKKRIVEAIRLLNQFYSFRLDEL